MDPRLTLELAELHLAEPNSGIRLCLATDHGTTREEGPR